MKTENKLEGASNYRAWKKCVNHSYGEDRRYEGSALNALLFTMIHICTSLVTLGFISKWSLRLPLTV